jgi:hypothetical protein
MSRHNNPKLFSKLKRWMRALILRGIYAGKLDTFIVIDEASGYTLIPIAIETIDTAVSYLYNKPAGTTAFATIAITLTNIERDDEPKLIGSSLHCVAGLLASPDARASQTTNDQ